MKMEILNPGVLTSVQDAGRFGRQRFGMSPAGAMDSYSMTLANILVGNPRNTGVLECTLAGPTIRFDANCIAAVTGADMAPTLNGKPVAMGEALEVPAGSTLKLGAAKNGCRTYIAVAGELDLPKIDGSQSTLLRSGIGGYEGRKLKAGDVIGICPPISDVRNIPIRKLFEPQHFVDEVTVRVILGPQEDRFTEAGLKTFLSQTYTVSAKSDRMASRLEGAKVEHITDANIISDGIPMGAVQVPGSGEPMIMMSEHQGSGGYTKIANVISVDIPLVAQCGPGKRIRFRAVSVQEAQALYRARLEEYSRLEAVFNDDYMKCFRICIGENDYAVGVNVRNG